MEAGIRSLHRALKWVIQDRRVRQGGELTFNVIFD